MSEQIYMMQISEIEKQDSQISGRWPLNEFRPVVLASDYAALQAECERLLAQVSALKSDPNCWQSGYDKGREDGAKAADAWKAQHARDSAELRRLCAERDAIRAELAAIKEQRHKIKRAYRNGKPVDVSQLPTVK